MQDINELFEKAKNASKNAYCPYSKFPVGACILYESGKIYTGCNVENASYGLSLCAERNAMSSAINMGETTKIKEWKKITFMRYLCGKMSPFLSVK